MRTPPLTPWGLSILPAFILGMGMGLTVLVGFDPVSTDTLAQGLDPSTWIVDRNGTPLREVVNNEGLRCRPVGLERMAVTLRQSVLASEDEHYYDHGGVDWWAVLRALGTNTAKGRTISGASTISMQLARLLFHQARSPGGKLQQAYDALRLEASFSKTTLLEAYLNRVSFGPAIEGAEAASQWYFKKPATELDWPEAALLAGMVQAPTNLDPFANPAGALERRNWVLGRLNSLGEFDLSFLQQAEKSPLPTGPGGQPLQAGHFTDYVLSLHPAAGKVETTLDTSLQAPIAAMVADHVRRFRSAGVTNAAVVVLDNHTGGILALVGSKDWSPGESGFVNGALANRQPGSTLKPLLYTLAFDRGWSPASVLADIETEYVNNDRTLYVPRNYSRTFRGPVLVKEALATSLNIPAIRLVRQLGVEAFLKTLRDVGFSGLDQGADHYGLGLILGNGEVNLLQLAGAYSTLARGGAFVPPSPFAPTPPETRVFSEVSSFLTTSILSDETMRIQAFGVDNPLMVGFPMAIKTGTSSDWKDSWTVGYTADYTVAVWSGDFEAVPMNQVSGSTGAGPLFQAVARFVQASWGGNSALPEAPAGVKKIFVCAESGDSPNEFCPRKMMVTVAEGPPRPLCTVHYLSAVDSRTGEQATDDTPEVFTARRLAYRLPAEYATWLEESGKFSPPPGPSRTSPSKGALTIDRPRPGDIYIVEPGYPRETQTLELAARSRQRVGWVDWWVDGESLGAAPWPYSRSWPLEPGEHRVQVRSGDLKSPEVKFEVR